MSELSEETKTVVTLLRHRDAVRVRLQRLIGELEKRSAAHDTSKLRFDELEGFVDIQRVAREHGIGTPEYEAVLREGGCLDLHFARNSHHPEHHDQIEAMGWLDIIEMVIDWGAAAETYGTNTLESSLAYQHGRHGFSDHQWWLIKQIVDWLSGPETWIA